MNAGAPTCPTCGGLNTNPQALQCAYCGAALPQMGYAQPPQQGYGGYGAPPPGGYGYGAPNPYQQPNPYAAPNPYANPYQQGGVVPQYPGQYPVQGFGGVSPFQPNNVYINRGGWSSGWSTFFWIRLGIAAIVIFVSLMGACVSAISH